MLDADVVDVRARMGFVIKRCDFTCGEFAFIDFYFIDPAGESITGVTADTQGGRNDSIGGVDAARA